MSYQATIVQSFFTGVFLFLPWIVLATLSACLWVWSNRRFRLGGQSQTAIIGLRTMQVLCVLAFAFSVLTVALVSVILL
jgi:hypothetical protein